jgi:hypothetical protein
VVAHPYPDILRQHPHHYKRNKRRPSKAEKSGQRGKMKDGKGNHKDPVEVISHRLSLKWRLAVSSENKLRRILWTLRRRNLHLDDESSCALCGRDSRCH